MIPAWLAPLISSLTVLVVGWMLNGAREREKDKDKKFSDLSSKVAGLELSMARELATKEDVAALGVRLDNLAATLGTIRDMVIRQDERGKSHDKE